MRAADLAQHWNGCVLKVASAGDVIGRRWNRDTMKYDDITTPADLFAELRVDGAELQALAVRACSNRSRVARDGPLQFKAVRSGSTKR